MKKNIALVIILLAILAFSSCNVKNLNGIIDHSTIISNESIENTESSEISVNYKAKIQGIKYITISKNWSDEPNEDEVTIHIY